jgi:hypothetical protein
LANKNSWPNLPSFLEIIPFKNVNNFQTLSLGIFSSPFEPISTSFSKHVFLSRRILHLRNQSTGLIENFSALIFKVESTPRDMKMRKTPSIFNFKGTFYVKKGLFGVDSKFGISNQCLLP